MSATTTAFKRRSIRATGRRHRRRLRRWQPLVTSSSLPPSLSTTSATSTSRWTRSKWSKAASRLLSPSWVSSMVAPEKFGTSRQVLFPFSEPLESRLVPSGSDIGKSYLSFFLNLSCLRVRFFGYWWPVIWFIPYASTGVRPIKKLNRLRKRRKFMDQFAP